MKEVAWNTDENGMLLGARAHDATLLALSFVPGRSLVLDFQRASTYRVSLRLEGLQEANMTIWESVELSQSFVWKAGHVPESTWSIPDGGWNVLFRGQMNRLQARSTAERIAARTPEPLLIVMNFAYGGQLAAICASVRVFEEEVASDV